MSREQAYMRLFILKKACWYTVCLFFRRKNILFPMRSSMFFQ
ncbi:hypothetical protein CHCC15075_2872 [Bacillus licheniformis]|nr:hypothetical protein N399_05555 [Bacillus licheniformis CG-B52]KUL09636.1 hypothetical protein LI17339_14455 [Bacillus licheniformis LMG 17339]KYC93904.1 hypothetical protein B4164_1204 [Bacillus licheniformis]TWJ47284.1 hypothetical protein CHCC5024_0492 [Bacillus licheniformis]TWJ93644.1 hypothetical protein CHCC20495_1641 [Bacillus licheniformis]